MRICPAIAVVIAVAAIPIAAQSQATDYDTLLTAPDGETYFQTNLRNNVLVLRGTIVERRPPGNPDTLVLGMSDPGKPDVTLKISANSKRTARPLVSAAQLKAAAPGSQVEFQGIVISFTSDPFMLVFDVPRSDFRILKPGKKAPTEKLK